MTVLEEESIRAESSRSISRLACREPITAGRCAGAEDAFCLGLVPSQPAVDVDRDVWIDIQAPHHLSHLLLLTVDAVAVGKLAQWEFSSWSRSSSCDCSSKPM